MPTHTWWASRHFRRKSWFRFCYFNLLRFCEKNSKEKCERVDIHVRTFIMITS